MEALRESSPQARHHYTQADQVNQLVSASEADPDMGFMARLLALCSLPRTNPGNRLQYKRVQNVLRELKKIKLAWPGLNYRTGKGVLFILPSKPAIPPTHQLRVGE